MIPIVKPNLGAEQAAAAVAAEREYRDSLPEAERAAREVLCLPVHPALNKQDLQTIVREVRAVC